MDTLDTIFNDMEKQTESDSDFYTMKKGANKLRILTDFVKVETVYEGEYPNSTYKGINYAGRPLAKNESLKTGAWAWCIDRATDELKIAQFGKQIIGQLVALKNDSQYAFKGYPMPYDITINNTGEGATRYSMIADRMNTELSEAEIAELNKKKPIALIVSTIVDKQTGKSKTATQPYSEYPQGNGNVAF